MSGDSACIPFIDVGALFDPPSAVRDSVDAMVMEAAVAAGFLAITAPSIRVAAARASIDELLRVFDMPDAEQRRLWRARYEPANPFVYRGWNPMVDAESRKQLYDLGPDIAHGAAAMADSDDPLHEATPLPDPAIVPGWHEAVARYYRSMEQVGAVLMRCLARGLDLPETYFDDAFAGGISTLRLIRSEPGAPPDDDPRWMEHDGRRRYMNGVAHHDSGFVTLLAQVGVGLQAQTAAGDWTDVTIEEGRLAVNFGGVLERWTGGRIRATEHRVLETGAARHSIPFFYEPRVDAVIAPLPGDAPSFEPFSYGDHLWSAMVGFPNFRSLEGRRPPRGVA